MFCETVLLEGRKQKGKKSATEDGVIFGILLTIIMMKMKCPWPEEMDTSEALGCVRARSAVRTSCRLGSAWHYRITSCFYSS